jgi:pimeloyl-ACP methyl ester carboxylesterase
VFGASAGGPIALELIIRRPRLVRAGILQDPSIFSVLQDPGEALAPRRKLLEDMLQKKGPRGAVEALMRYLNDDSVLATIPPDVLERMLGNADTILNVESPGFSGWRPSMTELAALRTPVVLMSARETLPVYKQVTDWLANQMKGEVVTVPGRHAFYYYRPQDLADALRPLLRRLTNNEAI